MSPEPHTTIMEISVNDTVAGVADYQLRIPISYKPLRIRK
jgi:hypothetical protein